MNLLEAPVLFYAFCLAAYVTHHGWDVGHTVLAWFYVALRIVHTFVHLTYNRIMHRFASYAPSNLVLLVMWLVVRGITGKTARIRILKDGSASRIPRRDPSRGRQGATTASRRCRRKCAASMTWPWRPRTGSGPGGRQGGVQRQGIRSLDSMPPDVRKLYQTQQVAMETYRDFSVDATTPRAAKVTAPAAQHMGDATVLRQAL